MEEEKKELPSVINEEGNIDVQDPGGGEAEASNVEKKKPTFDMQTMINDLNAREEEALKKIEEERKKESRYHRARSIISAIGDGLSGLANIYFATKGAPDMLKGTTSLSAKQQERWDKIRKEREARREAYLKAVRDNNRESLKNAYTQWKDDLEAKRKEEELELKRNKDARDEAKANYEAKAAKLEADLLTKKIDKATYDAEIAKIKMEVAGELEQAKINKYNRTGSGRSSGGSGGSGSKNYTKTKTIMVPVRDERGRIIGYEEREVTETKEYGRVSNSKKGWSAKK